MLMSLKKIIVILFILTITFFCITGLIFTTFMTIAKIALDEGITPSGFAGKDSVGQFCNERYNILRTGGNSDLKFILYDNLFNKIIIENIDYYEYKNHTLIITSNNKIYKFNCYNN